MANRNNKNVHSSQNNRNLQFPASAHEGIEHAQVGDRELQDTTDRKKGKRTTVMAIQVDLGILRPARLPWGKLPWGEQCRVPQNQAEMATRVS